MDHPLHRRRAMLTATVLTGLIGLSGLNAAAAGADTSVTVDTPVVSAELTLSTIEVCLNSGFCIQIIN